jgi:hypothetical protein
MVKGLKFLLVLLLCSVFPTGWALGQGCVGSVLSYIEYDDCYETVTEVICDSVPAGWCWTRVCIEDTLTLESECGTYGPY